MYTISSLFLDSSLFSLLLYYSCLHARWYETTFFKSAFVSTTSPCLFSLYMSTHRLCCLFPISSPLPSNALQWILHSYHPPNTFTVRLPVTCSWQVTQLSVLAAPYPCLLLNTFPFEGAFLEFSSYFTRCLLSLFCFIILILPVFSVWISVQSFEHPFLYWFQKCSYPVSWL